MFVPTFLQEAKMDHIFDFIVVCLLFIAACLYLRKVLKKNQSCSNCQACANNCQSKIKQYPSHKSVKIIKNV